MYSFIHFYFSLHPSLSHPPLISYLQSCLLHSREVDRIQLIFESYVTHLLFVEKMKMEVGFHQFTRIFG